MILFDPRLFPKGKKKADECEIQDEKLLYYYPLDADKNEKRNHVGL